MSIPKFEYPKFRNAMYLKARALNVHVPAGYSRTAAKPPGQPMRTLIHGVQLAAKAKGLYHAATDGTLNFAFQSYLIPPTPVDYNRAATAWLLAHLGEKELWGSNSGPWLNAEEDAMGEAYMHVGRAPWCAAIGGRRAYMHGGIDVHTLFPSLNADYCPSWESHIRAGTVSTDHRFRLIQVAKLPTAMRYGDILLFDWPGHDGVADHFGRYLGGWQGGQALVPTVEANTGPGAGGNQSEGDGVYKRMRNPSDIRIVGRLVRLP